MDKPWQSLNLEYIQHKPYPLVREHLVTHTGTEADFVYLPGHHNWVCVLPLTPAGNAILLRQYRHIWGRFCLDLPGGGADPGENPLAGAQRELLEEAGATAAEWIALPRHRFLGGFIASTGNPFLAFDCESVAAPKPEDTELVEVLEWPLVKVYTELEQGQDFDAAAVITLQWAKPILQQRGFLG